MKLVKLDDVPWEDGLDVIANMPESYRENLGPSDLLAGAYAKWAQKPFTHDPATTFRGDLLKLEPGFADLTDAYHDSVEECFFIAGDCTLSGEGDFGAGDYFWRPPGFVHGATSVEGFTALLFLEGVSEGDASGGASRVIRPTEMAGSNVLADDLQVAVGPRGWVRSKTRYLPWLDGPDYARGQGQLQDFDLERVAVKVLSSNARTGAQSLLVRLAPGYAQRAEGAYGAWLGAFLLEGAFRAGAEQVPAWSWIELDGGEVHAPWSSGEGALLFVKTRGFLERLGA